MYQLRLYACWLLWAIVLFALPATAQQLSDQKFCGPAPCDTPADQFASCQNGAKGFGFDSSTGLWAATCGNYNWAADGDGIGVRQSDAAYYVTCTDIGAPHTSCLRSGERRLIGALHTIGIASDRTMAGGIVYLPTFKSFDHGIYVDDGCGTLSDGTTRAECPRPYFSRLRSELATYSDFGPHTMLFVIQAARGVKIIGEGKPWKTEVAGVLRLGGVWIIEDRGNASATPGAQGPTLDGPSADLSPPIHRMIVGGSRDVPFCSNSSDTDRNCNEEQNDADLYAPGSWIYGAESSFAADATFTGNTWCLDNLVTGRTEADTTGTCRENRMLRCWSLDGTSTHRSDGGCTFDIDGDGFGGADDVDYGPCDGMFDALNHDVNTKGDTDIIAILNLGQCADGTTADGDCPTGAGHAVYMAEIDGFQAFLGTACGAANIGKLVEFGTGGSRGWPASQLDFRDGGTGANRLFVSRQGLYDLNGGGFRGIGRMPADWYGRLGTDSQESGTEDSGNDDTATTLTDSTAAFTVDALIGMTVIIDETGADNGPFFRTIDDNDGTSVTWTDALDLDGGETYRVSNSSCKSNEDDTTAEDEPACDSDALLGMMAGFGGRVADSTFFKMSQSGANKASIDGYPTGIQIRMDRLVIEGARRGVVIDSPGSGYWDQILFKHNITGGRTLVSIFAPDTTITRSEFRANNVAVLIQAGFQLSDHLTLKDLVFAGNRVSIYSINLGSGQNYLLENIQDYGTKGGAFLSMVPQNLGGDTNHLRHVTLRDIDIHSEVGGNGGVSVPTAAIVVNANGGAAAESISGVLIENMRVVSPYQDTCLIWFEDDVAPESLMDESRNEFRIINSSVDSAGAPAIACGGDGVAGGSHKDATDSTLLDLDTDGINYWPYQSGNRLNSEQAFEWPWNSVLAAQVPDCDDLPPGYTIAVHDDNGACANTTGVLDGAAVILTVCSCDGAGTWTVAN